MKIKVYVIDFEIPARVKKWGLRVGIPVGLLLGGGAIAYASGLISWSNGQGLTASDLNSNFQYLQNEIVALQAGNPDCPAGYTNANVAGVVDCRNGNDEIVKVGTGPTAFWIDRYEASIWQSFPPGGIQYGATTNTGVTATPGYPSTFPPNGQWTGASPPVYAGSVSGFQPSGDVTWFQAMEACAASGKRLPTGDEWLRAARGTNDPDAGNDGTTNADCNTLAAGARAGGAGTGCISAWGVEDLIGNLEEFTNDWYGGAGESTAPDAGMMVNMGVSQWPAGYGNDWTYNFSTSVVSNGVEQQGLPAAAARGGNYGKGTGAGIFYISLYAAPSHPTPSVGFRCVVPNGH